MRNKIFIYALIQTACSCFTQCSVEFIFYKILSKGDFILSISHTCI